MYKKIYKMSEVAQLHGITKKTLRHYDDIDLFKPDHIDGQNNYKYYTIKNFPILKQIIYLKDIGFDLSRIKYLLKNRTHDLMISELKHRQEQVLSQMQHLNNTEKSIDYLINFYEQANQITDNDLNRPSLQMHLPQFIYRLKADENTKESIMLTYRRILNHIKELNLFSHQSYGTVYYNNGCDLPVVSGSYISIPADFNIPERELIPGGKYICMYHKGTYYNQNAVTFLMDWLKENNYILLDDFYDCCIVDRSFTHDEDQMIMKLMIRVK